MQRRRPLHQIALSHPFVRRPHPTARETMSSRRPGHSSWWMRVRLTGAILMCWRGIVMEGFGSTPTTATAARPPRRRSWPPRASPGPRPAARGSPTCHGVLRRARTSEGPPHPTPPHSPARLNPLTTGGERPFSFWACPGRTMGWVIRRRHAARTAGPPARGPRT